MNIPPPETTPIDKPVARVTDPGRPALLKLVAPRYERLDVITEGGHGARRWRVIAVETDHYLVQSLFGAAEPEMNRWPHAAAEARTTLENRYPAEQIGVVCECGRAFLLPGRCCWCGKDGSPS